MDELYLIKPDISLIDEITSYRREFLDENSSMDGCGSLKHFDNPQDWLDQNKSLENKDTVPENWAQSTQFAYIRKSDKVLVGMIQIRHYFNDFLEKYGGNIGYSIRPSERKKGYAKKMLCDCLPYCREAGLNKILMTCLNNNEGSRKTILANGGVYESTVFEPNDKVYLERYWIDL